MPIAKLKFMNVLVNDLRCVKLVEFKNILGLEDLPNEYTRGKTPAFCNDKKTHSFLVRYSYSLIWTNILIGTFFSEKELARLLFTMKKAGERLTEINKRAKDKAWVGKTFEVEI